MDKHTARWLTNMTSTFYAQVSTSFDATRQTPWPGWDHVLELLGCCDASTQGRGGTIPGPHGATLTAQPLKVLDVACGNLRFERYIHARCSLREAWCVDNCDALLRQGKGGEYLRYVRLDVARELQDAHELALPPEAGGCDLAVCFGFMHHLPLASQRLDLLRTLVDATRPDGLVAVSFWQFLRDPRIRAKALSFEGADKGDYLLGWQDRSDVARYCHHFEEAEVDRLVYGVRGLAQQVCRYSADGRGGDLNRYVILRRRV